MNARTSKFHSGLTTPPCAARAVLAEAVLGVTMTPLNCDAPPPNSISTSEAIFLVLPAVREARGRALRQGRDNPWGAREG
jgi:hypothetical protein